MASQAQKIDTGGLSVLGSKNGLPAAFLYFDVGQVTLIHHLGKGGHVFKPVPLDDGVAALVDQQLDGVGFGACIGQRYVSYPGNAAHAHFFVQVSVPKIVSGPPARPVLQHEALQLGIKVRGATRVRLAARQCSQKLGGKRLNCHLG